MESHPPEDEDGSSTSLLRLRQHEFGFTRYRLVVTAGPDAGTSVDAVDGGEFSIGTAPANQLVLNDATVSRHHCALRPVGRGYLLRDLGSSNGTWLGGYKIEAAYPKPGALIRVGVTTLRFETLEERVVEPLSDEDRFGRLLGKSTAMRRVFAALPRIAASNSTVLILGETGTGKSLLAEAIHKASPRAHKPFVVVDCSSIPPTLIESELLGHERGAFTGAHAARAGAFEAAKGGTVFLDEIGELPLDVQPKLLRSLEERVIRRVGGITPIQLDVRIIAATNRDLRQAVNAGTFRSDVYYRLNTVMITIPALRARRDDIEFLAMDFYRQFSADDGATELPPRLLESWLARDWPGNVRELRGAVERAVLFGGDSPDANKFSLPPPPSFASPPARVQIDPEVSFREIKEATIAQWERGYLSTLMDAHAGNISRAARAARMDRNHLRELLRRHGLDVPDR